jgi:UDP-glucose 4-epimerase
VLEDALVGIDHVLFAGGGLLPPLAAASPFADVTGVLGPLLMTLEALRARTEIGLTYVSSGGTVYGNATELPVSETAPLRPVSPYGVSRLAAEMYIGMYARTFGLSAHIVRCANVYGPGQRHDRTQGAVAVFLHRVAAGMPVTIIGDGATTRDYVYVEDVARALTLLIVQSVDFDVVNLGSGHGQTVMEVLEVVSRVVGLPALLDFQPRRDQDVESIVLDISKLRSLVDFKPTPFEMGVTRTWEASRVVGAAAGP